MKASCKSHWTSQHTPAVTQKKDVTSEALFSKYDSNKDGVLDKKEAGRTVKEQKGKTFWMKRLRWF